jgi:crossover junction endodeoxyribonuclease RuvC
MIILGIDPGTLITGCGIVDVERDRVKLLGFDLVKNTSSLSMPLRLKAIHDGITKVIEQYKPDECAIETAFYGKNAQSALKIGQARGVSILSAVLRDIPIAEYSPREVKRAVTGNGGASKQQVGYMVKQVLQLRTAPKELDATDAIAVALCHLHHRGVEKRKPRSHSSWKEFLDSHPDKIVHL